jgi:hypothetical protein
MPFLPCLGRLFRQIGNQQFLLREILFDVGEQWGILSKIDHFFLIKISFPQSGTTIKKGPLGIGLKSMLLV